MGFHQHQKESPCNQKKFMDGAKGAGHPFATRFCWVARPDFAAGQVVLLWWQQYEGHQWHQRCRYRGLRRSTITIPKRCANHGGLPAFAIWSTLKWEHLGNLTDIESSKLGRSWIFIEQGANHERKLDLQITRLEFHLLHNESICKVLGHLYTLWE